MTFTSQELDYLHTLEALLRIPSVSAQSDYTSDVRRAAEFLQQHLARIGLHQSRLIDGPGHPLVYAEWLEAPGQPTLLLYGHYDVQPPEPLEQWETKPFEPTVVGDTLFGRGTADDKGPLLIMVHALEQLLRAGRLPINVRVLLEGEEETGGAHLETYLRAHADELKADAAIICDTEMIAPNIPTLTIGLRGSVYGELHVRALKEDLHSGVFGGVAPNAVQAAAEIVAALKDVTGVIRIPGFYDRVRSPSDTERLSWTQFPFDENAYRTHSVGTTELVGEAGFSIFERVWTRPTLEVHGIRGGYTGEGVKSVIPAIAVAKISTRIVPDQTVEETVDQLSRAIATVCPRGVEAAFQVLMRAKPYLIDPKNPYIQTAADVLASEFGCPTILSRSGGSLPVVSLLNECLGIPSVMFGFTHPDHHAHAPNERLHLPTYFRGIKTMARYFEIIGQNGRSMEG